MTTTCSGRWRPGPTGLWMGVMNAVGCPRNQPDLATFSKGVGMAQQRLPMRKIATSCGCRPTACPAPGLPPSLGIGPTAAERACDRAREAGIGWPLTDDLTSCTGEAPLSGPDDYGQGLAVASGLGTGDPPGVASKGRDAATGWEGISCRHPNGSGRSWFCELYGLGGGCRRRCGRPMWPESCIRRLRGRR